MNTNNKGYYLNKHKAIIIEGGGSDIAAATTLTIPNYYQFGYIRLDRVASVLKKFIYFEFNNFFIGLCLL